MIFLIIIFTENLSERIGSIGHAFHKSNIFQGQMSQLWILSEQQHLISDTLVISYLDQNSEVCFVKKKKCLLSSYFGKFLRRQ